jgi:imidazolonepropionase-like amidohydrolase
MTMPRLLLLAVPWCLALACGGSSGKDPAVPTPREEVTGAERLLDGEVVAKRVVVSLGRASGTSTFTAIKGDQRRGSRARSVLHVLENGRGPHTEAELVFADDGTLIEAKATGHHSFGAKFNSTFSIKDGVASWKSEEEEGSRKLTGPAFFVPVAALPELQGYLVKAALAHGGTIDLLPGGTARVEKTGELQVTVNGKAETLVGYSITGVELVPMQTWMYPNGTWFGTVSEWFSIVPEGWEAAIEPIIVEQRRLTREHDARLASDLAYKPVAAGLAYTHARVLDVERGRWIADQTVVVGEGVIKAVGPSKTVKIPDGVEVVDLAGKALLPGLFDMHAHLGEADGVLNLASGVTSARDVGNDPDTLDDFKRRYDEGQAIGPRVVRFGFIEGRNEKAASSKVTAETVEEAEAAVKFYADRKYEGVKIYNSMKAELVPVIAAAAHKRGLAVTGHVPVHMLAHEVVAAGYDGIEHINMLFLNFFATKETDTRDTTRFTLVGDKAFDFDLKSKPVKDFIKVLVQKKTLIDPTVNAFEDLLVGEQGKITPGLEHLVERLPVQTRRYYVTGGLPLDGEKRVRYKQSFGKMLELIKVLYDAKVRLVLGTDALAGLSFHHEMALFARAGVPNAAILRMATIEAARYLGLDKRQGSVTPGKLADLIVVDGDPLAQIGDIRKVVSAMRGGVVFQSAKLYEAVGVAPFSGQ